MGIINELLALVEESFGDTISERYVDLVAGTDAGSCSPSARGVMTSRVSAAGLARGSRSARARRRAD